MSQTERRDTALPRWLVAALIVVCAALLALLALRVVLIWQQPAGTLFTAITAATAALALLTVVALLLVARRLQVHLAALRAEGERSTQARRELNGSRRRLQLLLDHMPDGVLAFDAGGRIEWINPAARQIFRCSVDDVVGQSVATLVPGIAELLPDAPARAAPGMVAPAAPRRATLGRRLDGETFPLEIAPVMLEEGGRRWSMCVCRDITAAERVDRMKSEFVSMVSHELRTPLTSLRGSLSLLADGSIEGLPSDAQRLLRLASANAERLVMLVNDILDYEKLRAGALSVELQPTDLADLARRAIESLEGMARPAGVRLELLGDEAATPVLADASRLTQVLLNLMSNAVKYSPPHGRVRVEIAHAGERCRLTVRDDGPGVPAEFVPRLFLPFEQARDPAHRKQGGTGLGLAISRALMELMHGAIGVEPPARGRGAAFWIELPLHRDRPSTFGDLG
jgi:PAS domain S-box-containing protein